MTGETVVQATAEAAVAAVDEEVGGKTEIGDSGGGGGSSGKRKRQFHKLKCKRENYNNSYGNKTACNTTAAGVTKM